MLRLSDICVQRPVFATMLVSALVLMGATGYSQLSVDRFPQVDVPTVTVSTALPGASSEEVEAQVTYRLEEAANTVAGISELRSISAPGNSFLRIFFELDRDIDAAAQDVRASISRILGDLPPQADPPIVQRFDNEQTPIFSVALRGDRSIRELTELADKMVRLQLERVSGVGEAQVVGGQWRAVSIWADAARLRAYNIPIGELRDAIARQHVEEPGGHVTAGPREQTLRAMSHLTSAEDFNDIAVATRNGRTVRLRDVGHAEDGTRERRSLSRVNGVPAVTVEIRRQSDASTVDVIEGLRAELPAIEAQLPADVELLVLNDQSRYIYQALDEIHKHLVAGSILASLVVFVFLRNWRAMLLAAAAIPTSLIAAFGMMWLMDFSLNTVTMMALVLMIGVVIDDSLVVIENMYRVGEEGRLTPAEAAKSAMRDIGMPIVATTLCLVAVFVPVSFMSSVSGRFLFQFGLTAAVAALVSTFVAFTLAPALGARVLSWEQHRQGFQSLSKQLPLYAKIDRLYTGALNVAMNHRAAVALIAILVMGSVLVVYPLVPQEYTPGNVDEGEIEVVVRTPEGVSIHAMDEVASVVERELAQVPAIESYLVAVGEHLSSSGSLNQARAFVQLKDHDERRFSLGRFARALLAGQPGAAFEGNYSQAEVRQLIRERLAPYDDLRVSVRNARAFQWSAVGSDIDFIIQGPDLEALGEYAERLRERAPELGIVDAETTLQIDRPELQARIDRTRAAQLGVSMADLAGALRLMVGGDERVARFRDPITNEDYDIQLRLVESDRTSQEAIRGLYVPAQDGRLVPVGSLIEFEETLTPSRIDRIDRQRQVSLRANVAPGYALGDRITAIQGAVTELNLPIGYSTQLSGSGRELEETFQEFLWVFAVGVLFVYIILAAQFEHFAHPLTIMLSVPLTVPFAFLTLWGTGITLNLYSALGLLVLFGIVMKNGILQIDRMNSLRDAGMPRLAAVIQGNRDRLRPILMTTLTLIAGMTPLAVAGGVGAEERRAAALVIIGGQSMALFLSLIVTPVVYTLLDDLALALRRPFHRFRSRAWLPSLTTEPEAVRQRQHREQTSDEPRGQ